MNARVTASILLALSLALGAGLWWSQRQVSEVRRTSGEQITTLSNSLAEATSRLDRLRQDRIDLEAALGDRAREVGQFSNRWSTATSELRETAAAAATSEAQFKTELAQRDVEIGRLETQKSELSGQLEVLNGKIATLEGKIADTERRLAASEGDKEFLQRELRRMQAEKVALEQRFQDLAQLREQVQVLKEEMGIARRLDAIRRGGSLFDRKGAQLLQEGIPRPPESGSVRGDLNVEVTPEGATVEPGPDAVPIPGNRPRP